jgi:hypothetical protein
MTWSSIEGYVRKRAGPTLSRWGVDIEFSNANETNYESPSINQAEPDHWRITEADRARSFSLLDIDPVIITPCIN